MRLARPTTRRLMAAVAVAASSAWVVVMVRRSEEYCARAAIHAEGEAEDRARVAPAEEGAAFAARRAAELAPEGLSAPWSRLAGWWLRQADRERSRAGHSARLRRKYERVASRPWLPVRPDPPPPPPGPELPDPHAAPLSVPMAIDL